MPENQDDSTKNQDDSTTVATGETSRREFVKMAATGLTLAATSKIALAQAVSDSAIPNSAVSNPAIPNRAIGRPMPELEESLPGAPDERVGYAVVGLGKFALNQILPNFEDSKKSKLVALVSGDANKAQKVARQYNLSSANLYNYQNFDSIRNNPAVRVVYVITPNSLHREFVERAARAGKNVLCEKPFATNSADCRAMIATCRNADVKLMVAYRAQYEPFNLEAIRISRSGELGKIVNIVADHGRPVDASDPADQWRLKKAIAGGGPLPDIGIYSLNACRYLTGEEPIEISAQLVQPAGNPKFREVEQSVVWTMRFPSGVLTTCTATYDFGEVKRYRVFFENGWLDLDPATDYDKHRLTVSKKAPAGLPYKSVEQELPIPEGNQFAAELDHMSNCVLQNLAPKTPGEEGLRDVRLIEVIYEAARTGRTLKI
ncbi:putative dehydrogenase [Abditibacterium utsteinense]|uniref:Putative dehydrogenase n=2 Tax=Abditibacterium utsteinense TaxID=1960156 RepID=A0A2S8SU72_9BACT|nr:putative dehydrogenase [Abditibacterium utsteinense]